MTSPAPDRAWLEKLRAGAIQAPLRPRVPLWAGESVIGSVEPDFLHQIALQPLADGHHPLLKEERPEGLGWRLMGDVTTSLNRVATALHEAGLAGAWRNEQLAVPDQLGHRKGTVERAAVRPLGITTLAVHLVGQTPNGRIWVQQRALDKANDPGLWDTLMGGMVSAADTVETALARETWEEAGLRVAELRDIRYGGRLSTRRPSTDGRGAGYVVEDIDWYVATVPDGLVPENRDGEVARFDLLETDELLRRMAGHEFTAEAALILADYLGH
ncbi:NUDIX hydrolase [Polaromonas jejuensis]|uniref:NUDIX domain-containing protein n=1 Tax=Polaromonas jejuensis TaxID=457502 RepID=A0ABW0QDN6_9BURK|nr:NUDIX domain-containing protein [Polaromonas jejuensis]